MVLKSLGVMMHTPSLGEKNWSGFAGCRGETQMFFICGSPVSVPVSDSNVPQFVADTGTCSQAEILQAAGNKEIAEYVLRVSVIASVALVHAPSLGWVELCVPGTLQESGCEGCFLYFCFSCAKSRHHGK